MSKRLSLAAAEYAGVYLPNVKGYSPHTVRSYCNGLSQFIEFAESYTKKRAANLGASDITHELGSAYVDHMLAKHLSPSTIEQRMSAVRAFLKWLSKKDLSFIEAREAMLEVDLPKRVEVPMAWLSVEEVRLILSLPNPKDSAGLRELAMLTVLYDAAARAQEVCNLNVDDVNPEARSIRLSGKGRKERVVPLSKQAAQILRAHIKRNCAQGTETPLFTGRTGARTTPSGVEYVVGKYVKKGKAASRGRLLNKKVTPHTFRHARAMHLLESGVELIYIRDFLGHNSVRTTEVYAKANPEKKRAAIEKRAANLGLSDARGQEDQEEDAIRSLRDIARSYRLKNAQSSNN